MDDILQNGDIISEWAPIVIPTLCRYDHLKNCIESLAKCHNCNMVDVYVCVDYPCKESHVEGHSRICEYLTNTAFPFHRIKVINRDHNLGESNNISEAIDEYIKGKYYAWILSEDDNCFSTNYLDYMNYYLRKYKDDYSVYAVNGYSFPLNYGVKDNCIYKSYMYSPWGVGFWEDRRITNHRELVDSILCNRSMVLKLLRKAPFLFHKLVAMRYNEAFYGDLVTRAICLLNDKICISPIISKVKNCGYDGSGINCTDDGGLHLEQKIDASDFFTDNGEVEIKHINKLYNKYFRVSLSRIFKSTIMYVIYRIKIRCKQIQY